MSENTRFVCFQWHHLQDGRKSLTRCADILGQIVILDVSSSCTALGVLERANLLSNLCENPPSMVLLYMKSRLVHQQDAMLLAQLRLVMLVIPAT
jgi:hypothetical protein